MEAPFDTRATLFGPARTPRGALGVIFMVILLDIVGLGILRPLQAYIVRQYSSDALSVTC